LFVFVEVNVAISFDVDMVAVLSAPIRHLKSPYPFLLLSR
jgi:hypothetical protein